MKKYFASSELIINEDGSVFHLHVKPEWLADKVILVGDPGRVALVASHFENKECEIEEKIKKPGKLYAKIKQFKKDSYFLKNILFMKRKFPKIEDKFEILRKKVYKTKKFLRKYFFLLRK